MSATSTTATATTRINALPHIGEALAHHAALHPERPAVRDGHIALTFRDLYERAVRAANALLGLGLEKGECVAILAHNRAEWFELYAAAALAGLVAVPVNFRLTASEAQHLVEDSGARALVVENTLLETAEALRDNLADPLAAYLVLGSDKQPPPGMHAYETLLQQARSSPPRIAVAPQDTWTVMYTSGTTGKPKGAVRDHESYTHFFVLNAVEFGFQRNDTGMLVMPLCHVNSVYYGFTLLWLGGTVVVWDRKSFDAEAFLHALCTERVSYTSIVPTHAAMMLELPQRDFATLDTQALRTLLISSAPARRETKLGLLERFENSRLFEAYGSTEAGLVTLLHPEEQFEHLGSIGREIIGSAPIRLLDDAGNPVAEGDVGELWSRTPTTFRGYLNQPQATQAAICRDGYCFVGDLARRDAQGYYTLVDRKHNMIITGGENVYPSEVEAVVATHPDVKDVAVIGVPDARWGEQVTAVVVLKPGAQPDEQAILEHLRPRMAGYKRPRRVLFVADEQMPRTPTGKVLHRVLRERHGEAEPPE